MFNTYTNEEILKAKETVELIVNKTVNNEIINESFVQSKQVLENAIGRTIDLDVLNQEPMSDEEFNELMVDYSGIETMEIDELLEEFGEIE